jgi:protein ImuB
MTKVVSLFLPSWPSDRLLRRLGASAPPPETPLALVGRDGRRRIVTAVNAAARAVGVRPGMAATQAHALVPGLVVHDATPADDAAGLDRLALWALRRYAPIVAADPPDGLVIDATGATHLLGGDAAMLADLVDRLQAAGVAARATMAPSWGSAHALARFGPEPVAVIAPGQLTDALAPLPVAALRLPADMVEGLRRLGFDTVGELAAQSRAPLVLRFGPELGRRLDQALGQTFEIVTPIEAPELIQVSRGFAEPIGAPETLARYTGLLVDALCAELEAKGLGARRLDLRFHRVDNRIEAIRVGAAKPVRMTKRLTRLLTDRLETVAPGFGIERMTLAAPLAEPLTYKPGHAFGETGEADVSALIDTLANKVGADKLYRLARIESDVPERSVGKVAPLAGPTATRWPVDWPRPTRLLDRPEPVETMALLPDHPPVHFTWRGVRRRVKRADGPERIFGEWARSDAELLAVRDYFLVEDDAGDRYWLYRTGDGTDPATGSQAWFLHGLFG